MYKIAVIGGSDSVIGFKALGLDTYAVNSVEETRHTLRELTRPRETGDEYAIIYIEENKAADVMDEIRKFNEMPTPAIILIPGRDGPVGLGQSALTAAVEKAVGSNIL